MTDHGRLIVAGCDASERSHDAVALAELLARLRRADLLLATAYQPDYPMAPDFSRRAAERRRDADALLAAAQERVATVPVSARALPSRSPARALHELAEASAAEAVVVGSTHRGHIGRVLPGSTGRALLRESPCAVAVAPRGYSVHPGHLGTVGVAYDLTSDSDAALAYAVAITSAAGASLRLVTVEEPHTRHYADARAEAVSEASHASRHDLLRHELMELSRELPPELRADARVRTGLPGPQLVKEADEGIDLLVLGSRSYGPIGRALAGSVSTIVASGASCPVLVVPRQAPHAGAGAGRPAAVAAAALAEPIEG